MNEIYVLIPARSGSKSVKNKNIRDFHGLPLFVHSIIHSQNCQYIKRNNIFVSTDSEEYAEISRRYDVNNVIIRPKDISGDLSTDLEVFQHFMGEILKDGQRQKPTIFVHLRPTYPNRKNGLLDECIKRYLEKKDEYTSLRTIIPTDMIPYKMYHMEDSELIPIFNEYNDIKEPYNQCRQIFPKTYVHNGCIDIISIETIESGSMTGERIYGYVMDKDEDGDIDTEEDMRRVKEKYKMETNDGDDKEDMNYEEYKFC